MAFRHYADAWSAALGYVSPAECLQIWTVFPCSCQGRWAQAEGLTS